MVPRKVTLPNNMLDPVFGKVFYRTIGDENEVSFIIMVATSSQEHWRTAVALDASVSMQAAYGKALSGSIPPNIQKKYIRKGWMKREERDQSRLLILPKEGFDDAMAKGYIKWSENIVEPEAQKFLQYLANRLDGEGKTDLIYWACGAGDKIESVGRLRADDLSSLKIDGPKEVAFGTSTHLLPALRYFDEKFNEAKYSFFVFITDSRLDDFTAVKSYSIELAKKIESKERNPTHCVLIGVGPDIDKNQMRELDEIETGTNIDIWDYQIVEDMRAVNDIITKLTDESLVVTSPSAIYDDQGNEVAKFPDGLPGRVTFRVPKTSNFFELQVGGQERIRQNLHPES